MNLLHDLFREAYDFFSDLWRESKWVALIVGFLVFLMVAAIVVAGTSIYLHSTSETFTLKKSEWECVQSGRSTSLSYNPALKVTIPITNTECVVWRRREG